MFNEPKFIIAFVNLQNEERNDQNPYRTTTCKCIQKGESKATKVMLTTKKTSMQESLGWYISLGDGRRWGMHRLLGPM